MRSFPTFGIGLEQARSLQETTHTPGNGVGKLGELAIGRRLHPLKPLKRPVPALDVHVVKKSIVVVLIQECPWLGQWLNLGRLAEIERSNSVSLWFHWIQG